MYRLNENVALTGEMISQYIMDFELSKKPTLKKYKDYYEGKHAILTKSVSDESKPNNRVVHSYANYISNTLSSYFMGNNVSYTSKEEKNIEELTEIFRYNDEASENLKLAKDSSVYGLSYELVYVDKQGNIRFKCLSPLECIAIYDDTLEDELLYLIRYYNIDNIDKTSKRYIEVYTRNDIQYYVADNQGLQMAFVGAQLHGFKGYVPVSIYKNNEEELNDFGKVISLIDAYDNVVSDSVNDLDQFADSYLILKGLGNVDTETLAEMKEKRVLLLDEESSADFLVKNVNDTYAKNIADRINDDIYKFSGCVDLTSDVSALSGVAIKYRLLAMENNASAKETQFKKGLLRRIELISAIINTLNIAQMIVDVSIKFTRNLPTDESESVDLVNKLQGLVSDETLLSMLPFIEDAKVELEKMNKANAIYEDAHEHQEVSLNGEEEN